MPWKKFIHPEHLEHTYKQLQQEKLSSRLQFVQIYINKAGEGFVAQVRRLSS